MPDSTVMGAVPRAGRREWLGLVVLALPTLLMAMDQSVLYLALLRLSENLGASSTQSLWILDIYGFLLAGFLVTMGNLGDRGQLGDNPGLTQRVRPAYLITAGLPTAHPGQQLLWAGAAGDWFRDRVLRRRRWARTW